MLRPSGRYLPGLCRAIATLAEGEISELQVGLNATMNALFLKDLAVKTRRGLRVG
jgi:site-specific DNA recombinase